MSPAPANQARSTNTVAALLVPRSADSHAWLQRNAYLELAAFAYDLAVHYESQPEVLGDSGPDPQPEQWRWDFIDLVTEVLSQALQWYGHHEGALQNEPLNPRQVDDRERFGRVVAKVSNWEKRRKRLGGQGTAQREAGRYE